MICYRHGALVPFRRRLLCSGACCMCPFRYSTSTLATHLFKLTLCFWRIGVRVKGERSQLAPYFLRMLRIKRCIARRSAPRPSRASFG